LTVKDRPTSTLTTRKWYYHKFILKGGPLGK
jgi:hypothetical protein